MKKLHSGETLTKSELKEIADNFVLSKHAKMRIEERHKDVNIREAILNPLLAYYNTDGTVNIAVNKYEYLVVGLDCYPYKVITYKERSKNKISIFSKRKMAIEGFERKERSAA